MALHSVLLYLQAAVYMQRQANELKKNSKIKIQQILQMGVSKNLLFHKFRSFKHFNFYEATDYS
jgi:hypothetical protein